MNILVTGAAGYIGSVVTRQLIERGYRVIAVDDLSCGHREAVAPDAAFIQADLDDASTIGALFEANGIAAVVHLAARTSVGESIRSPDKYFHTNIVAGIGLLNAALKHRVQGLIFSSSAAVYGLPNSTPITEGHPLSPINPYGESKLIFEKILRWYGLAHGLRFISLRYFNASGASNGLGEDHAPETHLIPNVIKVALGQRDHVDVFGTDYPTNDGSCIRDYVHVADIAKAHVLALNMITERPVNKAYNLGTGYGHSVLNVIKTAAQVTGTHIPMSYQARRPGDPAALVASAELAKADLGWIPEHSNLSDIVDSAWRWATAHPKGYNKAELRGSFL